LRVARSGVFWRSAWSFDASCGQRYAPACLRVSARVISLMKARKSPWTSSRPSL
jgi:hypothetical protein